LIVEEFAKDGKPFLMELKERIKAEVANVANVASESIEEDLSWQLSGR
jgi:hypothetical protein